MALPEGAVRGAAGHGAEEEVVDLDDLLHRLGSDVRASAGARRLFWRAGWTAQARPIADACQAHTRELRGVRRLCFDWTCAALVDATRPAAEPKAHLSRAHMREGERVGCDM